MKTVIFDFDGTIADSFDYVFGFLRSEAKLPALFTPAEAMGYRGLSMKAMAIKLGIPWWRLVFVYFKGRRIMRAHLMRVAPFAGMADVLRNLHNDGWQLFVVSSNSPRNVRRFLKHNQLDGYFRTLRGDAGIHGKVAIMRRLLLRYHIDKRACWSVGDEIGDCESAHRVGIRCVGVSWGFAEREALQATADAVADTPAEIIGLLR